MKIKARKFKDRIEATQMLLEVLPITSMKQEEWIVLAISTGSVPIALEIAKQLSAQFDFFFAEKIYTQKNNQCEIAIITETKEIIIHEELMRAFNLQLEDIYQESDQAYFDQIKEYKRKYRNNQKLIDVTNKNVLIVDEGLNTGLTMMSCIKSIINQKAKSICVSVPILPEITVNDIETIADDLYYVEAPPHFISIDFYYENLQEIQYADITKLIQQYKKENNVNNV